MKMTKLAEKAQSMWAAKSNAGAMSAIEREQEAKQLTKFVLTSALVCLVAFEPSIAAATTTTTTGGSTTDNLTTAANNILGLFTGTLGKAVATIAVVVMGMMAMFGKLEWERAFKVILGIAIVFGAAKFVTLIAGGTVINSI